MDNENLKDDIIEILLKSSIDVKIETATKLDKKNKDTISLNHLKIDIGMFEKLLEKYIYKKFNNGTLEIYGRLRREEE